MADHTHGHGRELLNELAPLGRELRALIPGVYEGFAGLHEAAFADGDLDRKTKELLALAIAIAVRCDGNLWRAALPHTSDLSWAGPVSARKVIRELLAFRGISSARVEQVRSHVYCLIPLSAVADAV